MRSSAVTIRLSDRMREAYRASAAEAGVTFSDHVRGVLERVHTLDVVREQQREILEAIAVLDRSSDSPSGELVAAIDRLSNKTEAQQREVVAYLRAIANHINPQIVSQVTARRATFNTTGGSQ